MESRKKYALLIAMVLSVIGLPPTVVDLGWFFGVLLMFIEIPVIYFLYLHIGYGFQDKMYGKHAEVDERLRYCHMYAASIALMAIVSVFTFYIYVNQFWSLDFSAMALASSSVLFVLLVFGVTFQLKYRWG